MIGNAAAQLPTYVRDRRSSGVVLERNELTTDTDRIQAIILRSCHVSRNATGRSARPCRHSAL